MTQDSDHRFVAIDVHKSYLVVGAVAPDQTLALRPRQVPLVEFATWAERHLRPTDQVVLEATTNTWDLYDLLVPLVARVVVADPAKTKAKIASPVKTDNRDTIEMAKLLASNSIPAVWVPPPHVRELRAIVAHRQRLVRQRTAAKNRLHAVLIRHNLVPPPGDLWAAKQQAWWDAVALPPVERLRAQHDRATIQHLSSQIGEVEAELARLSVQAPWADQVPFLIQLPGVALVTAMTVLSAIGDITRFSSAKRLVGYSGLGVKVHASGQTHRSGGITKAGRRELRAVLVEAAHAATQASPLWRTRFEQLAARIGKPKATVALARKLLVLIWHVLTRHQADRLAEPERVARRLFRWGANYGLATQQGLSRAAFVRQQLDRIGVGGDLVELVYSGYVFDLQGLGPPRAIRGTTGSKEQTATH